ncbi:unnamed protein product [marine sediment metagenome]|uniref:Uncharacterized protein n=1 Tax=marine sediment metagenome TaxID=412755 RepID=X1GGK1_9ZZZZ
MELKCIGCNKNADYFYDGDSLCKECLIDRAEKAAERNIWTNNKKKFDKWKENFA